MNRAKLWVCWSAVAVLAASPLLAAKGRAAASSPKARPRIPIVIGLVTFNAVAAKADPKSDATAASHLFVAKLLDAVSAYGRSKSDRAYDVDFELVRGNYYQVLHWLRSGQIDGAVLSPFSLYVAQATTASWPAFEPMPVLEFPTAGLTPAEDGGRPYFRAYANGRFVSDPAASLELCLRDEPPCTFEFVNHLSTTGFIYPLLRIYQSKNPPEFKKLLSRGHFSLWHGATAAPHERTIQFTYGGSLVANTPAEQATWSPLFLGERFPRDVLILNCKTPSLQHVCSEVRAILQQYVSSKRPQAQPAEKNAPLVGYRTAEPFDPATQNELKEEIKQLRPRLAQYWNDWYVRGKFDFTVQEIVDLLMDDQTIANHRNAAIVLPGGGVRGAYQARILDELYDKYVLNQAAPKDEKQRLEINCIVGTSGGALMGYLAARRTPSDKDKLADLWEKNKKVVINPSQVFPFFSPLRTISILLAITLLGVIAAMLTRRIPASPGAPLFVTIGFAAIIIAAPAFIWRLSFVDLRYQPTWEPFFYAFLIVVLHALHTTMVADPARPQRRRSSGALVLYLVIALGASSLALAAHVLTNPKPDRLVGGMLFSEPALAAIAAITGAAAIVGAAKLRGAKAERQAAYVNGLAVLALFGIVIGAIMLFIVSILKKATVLEMTGEYWIWMGVSAAFATAVIVIVALCSRYVFNGFLFLVRPLGDRPFPYTPILTLIIGGFLAVAAWIAFVAPALYNGDRGAATFRHEAEKAGRPRTRFLAAMTNLGTPTGSGRQLPPGDYYAYAKGDPGTPIDKLDRFLDFNDWEFREAVSASGSPFPIYPGRLINHRKGNALFMDGGFTHLVPVEGAVLVGAKQVLIVANVSSHAREHTGRGLLSLLLSDTARAFEFLFDRSQITDTNVSHDVLVATIAPAWDEANPFLMDFRSQQVSWLIGEAGKDISVRRPARVISWGEPHPLGTFALPGDTH